MSFILDALKKSEADRQEKSTPDISDVPTAAAPSRSGLGAWYLVGFLSIVVVALIAVLLRPAKGPAPIVSQELTLPARGEPAPERAPPSTSTDTVLPDPPASREDSRPAPEPPPRAEPAPSEPVARAPQPAPASETQAASPTVRDEPYLTFNDLRATGSIDLPDLHIDLHVFSEEPGNRFVFINMNQYRENAVLTEGPRLREITSDGVLLEYVGTTFLLPRD